MNKINTYVEGIFSDSTRLQRIAYIIGEVETTYDALFAKAKGIFGRIASPSQRQVPVVIYGHKQMEMGASFLACVLAGRPYIPVDISVPGERLSRIIALSGATCLIDCTNTIGCGTTPDGIEVLAADNIKEGDSEMDLSLILQPHEAMYIMFTSGSTGEPKGVVIPLEGLNDFLTWVLEDWDFGLRQARTILNHALFTFDISIFDFWGAMATGATFLALDHKNNRNTRANIEILQKYKPEIWMTTPTVLDIFLADRKFSGASLPWLETFVITGEPFRRSTSLKTFERFPKSKMINLYGPTEGTVEVVGCEIRPRDLDGDCPLPIGKSKPRSEILIMDSGGRSLSPGETGEIVIVGKNVALGYIGFAEDKESPFFTRDGRRAYRTGDIGYLSENGLYYCQGRLDRQIKFHGHRIELDEIENVMSSIVGVLQAACLDKKKGNIVSRLVAYIEPDSEYRDETPLNLDSVRCSLRDKLPEYMVPQSLKVIANMPLTPSGKIDRVALRKLMDSDTEL